MGETLSIARSPLTGWPGIVAPGLRVVEVPFRTQVNVRTADPAGVGIPLPVEPGTSQRIEDTLVLWLGPDEWLITAAPGAEPPSVVDGSAASIVDVSAQRTTLLVEGEHARDLLAHGCPLDLHPTVFPVGHCAQSTLARTQVVLVRVAEDAFHVLVRASFARYLADWLDDAAVEYGTPG
jgi:sarcosine oxidase subunit gamma